MPCEDIIIEMHELETFVPGMFVPFKLKAKTTKTTR